MTEPERKPCGTCGESYTVTAAGGMRYHTTKNPDFQAGPDSRQCRGVGEPPASAAAVALAEDMSSDDPQCRLCKHPVELTDNGRARSHLTPEQTPRPCPAGSDFPLGTYPEVIGTTDGLVATLAFDCEHREVGACYDCYAAREGEQPSMAEQFKTTPFTEALARETADTGTVADALPEGGTMAERFSSLTVIEQEKVAAAVAAFPDQRTPEQKETQLAPALDHLYTDPSGTVWAHPGPEETCTAPDCVTMRQADHEHNFVTCEDNRTCVTCGITPGEMLPPGETDDGRPCDHSENMFGEEDGKPVCVDCGTVCTHPTGFQRTVDDQDEDMQERVVGVCEVCGTVDPADELSDCPHPETHRAGCGCPGDDSAKEQSRPAPEDDPQVRVGDLERGDHFTRRGTLMLVDGKVTTEIKGVVSGVIRAVVVDGPHKGMTGELTDLNEVVERAPASWFSSPDPRAREADAAIAAVEAEQAEQDRQYEQSVRDGWEEQQKKNAPVLVGELGSGDHFLRKGFVMRCIGERNGAVVAVVVEGPQAGATGVLPDLGESVERTHCRHEYSYADDGQHNHGGSFCNHCGAEDTAPVPTTEQETGSWPTTPSKPQPPSSSPAPQSRTTVPAPGSRPTTPANAPAADWSQSNRVTSSAPTGTASTNGRSAAVTTPKTTGSDQSAAAAQFLAGASGAHGEKETDRDSYGRYLILNPDTGKQKAYTRATTFAKSISDTYTLSQWSQRMVLLGATQRPDIVQRAHGKHVRADKELLNGLTADLKSAAGDKVAANLGTSMHSFTEMADRAWHTSGGPRSILDQVPPDSRAMVETYIRLLEETGLEPVPDLIEFTTVVKQYNVAGTSDNCYRTTRALALKIGRTQVLLSPGEYVIGDKKTGRDLSYGWQEIAIQLGVYAQGLNTTGKWDRAEKTWYPDPLNGAKVRLDVGVVVHLPVDEESDKQPAVYGVDLESGWNAAVLCERVRAWRNVRNLASPVTVADPVPVPVHVPDADVASRTNVRPATLREKAEAVTSNGEASAVWREAKSAGKSDAELGELTAIMQARLAQQTEPAG